MKVVDLPHRFVPTTSKFVSPVRIVAQSGHGNSIIAVAFSPCSNYFASADQNGWLRIWALETLDILGIYLLDFKCQTLEWNGTKSLICKGADQQRVIEFIDPDATTSDTETSNANAQTIHLLGSPEFSVDGDSIKICYDDQEFLHTIPGLIQTQMDPCERYIVALSPNTCAVLNTFEDEVLMDIPAPNNHKWCALHISWRGDYFIILSDDGSLWKASPVHKKYECILKGNTLTTAWDLTGKSFIIYGDERGNLSIFDLEKNALSLRTPRQPREFCAVYPAPEKPGFLALRPESATAFFGQSQEILSSAPLPAPVCASCAGTAFSELVVACRDNAFYRLKLDDNSISKIGVWDRDIDALAASSDTVFIHSVTGEFAILNAKKLSPLNWSSSSKPLAMAVAENGRFLATVSSDTVEIFDRSNKLELQRIAIQNVAQIAFGKDKSANTLLLFMADLRILAIDARTGNITELNTLNLEHGRIISVAPADKSYLFVLIAAEHGQMLILKVGLNSGKSSQILRVFAVGTQIWGAAYDENSVCLRNDTECLKIVSGLKAFSIDDWTRSDPLNAH